MPFSDSDDSDASSGSYESDDSSEAPPKKSAPAPVKKKSYFESDSEEDDDDVSDSDESSGAEASTKKEESESEGEVSGSEEEEEAPAPKKKSYFDSSDSEEISDSDEDSSKKKSPVEDSDEAISDSDEGSERHARSNSPARSDRSAGSWDSRDRQEDEGDFSDAGEEGDRGSDGFVSDSDEEGDFGDDRDDGFGSESGDEGGFDDGRDMDEGEANSDGFVSESGDEGGEDRDIHDDAASNSDGFVSDSDDDRSRGMDQDSQGVMSDSGEDMNNHAISDSDEDSRDRDQDSHGVMSTSDGDGTISDSDEDRSRDRDHERSMSNGDGDMNDDAISDSDEDRGPRDEDEDAISDSDEEPQEPQSEPDPRVDSVALGASQSSVLNPEDSSYEEDLSEDDDDSSVDGRNPVIRDSPPKSESPPEKEEVKEEEPAPAPSPPAKKKSLFDDSDSESSVDDSTMEKEDPAPLSTKKKPSSFDDSDSDGSDDESTAQKEASPKKRPYLDDSGDEGEISDRDSSDKKAQTTAANVPAPEPEPPKKKSYLEDSDDDEASDSDSSSKKANAAAPPAPVTPTPKKKSYLEKEDSDSDSSDKNDKATEAHVSPSQAVPTASTEDDKPGQRELPDGIVDLPEIEDIPDVEEPNITYDFTVPNFSIPSAAAVDGDNLESKKKDKESSSDEESSVEVSDSESSGNKVTTVAPTLSSPKKKSYLDDSDEDEISDSDSSSKKAKAAIPPAPAPPSPQKKSYLDDSDEDEISDSDSSSQKKAKLTAPPVAAPPSPQKTFSLDDSDEDEISDSDSSSKKEQAATPPVPAQSSPKKQAYLDNSDSDDISGSDSSSSSSSKKAKAAGPAPDPILSSPIKKSHSYGSDPVDSNSDSHDKAGTSRAVGIERVPHCAACGMEADFSSEGLFPCDACESVLYCSTDCATWHFQNGGHANTCKGGSAVAKDTTLIDRSTRRDSVVSIDPFAADSEHSSGAAVTQGGVLAALRLSKEQTATSVPVEQKCKACGMDSEFVPEGMKNCSKCQKVPYCSTECQQWDWEQGGHKQVCTGVTEAQLEMQPSLDKADDASIEAFDPGAGSGSSPQSTEGVMAALQKSRAEATKARASATAPHPAHPAGGGHSCQSCGMEEEFVPEGMVRCDKCFKVSYCSDDCMKWHWEHGGHSQSCQGATERERGLESKSSMGDASEGSIEAFDPNSGGDGGGILAALSKSRAEITKARVATSGDRSCQSCGMEEEFVPDGMVRCDKCFNVSYCSDDCMKWHWEHGGHKQVCQGATYTERTARSAMKQTSADNDGSEGSIDAFGPGSGEMDAPQSKEGVIAALSAARAQTAANAEPSVPQDQCVACGMDKDFVSEGMKICSKCKQVPYCSFDCMEWHWKSIHKQECKGISENERKENERKIQRALSNDSEGSIDALVPGAAGAPKSKAGVLAEISKARIEASSKKKAAEATSAVSPNPPLECQGCGMEDEYVPEGMRMCTKCKMVPYCSMDCMSWHWERGGHSEVCPGLMDAERKANLKSAKKVLRDEGSIDALSRQDPPPQQEVMSLKNPPKKEASRCVACGMEQEFVPDGMLKCPNCSEVEYCSEDCKEWHWESGGHKADCTGPAATKPAVTKDGGESDGSIEVLEADSNQGPQSKDGILDAISKAREEAKSQQKEVQCKACGTSPEFVPDGMKKCKTCQMVPYCSDECMEWDWESGGHKAVCAGANQAVKEAPAQSTLSLRDQITGGNDRQDSRQLYDAGPRKPAGSPKEVSTLKLELERTKRQYNDAVLSRAALERTLNNIPRATPPVPSASQTDNDGLRKSIERFLARLETLLEADRNRASPQEELAREERNAMPAEDLAAKVMRLEKSIQSLIAQSNQITTDKNALEGALQEAKAKSNTYGQPVPDVMPRTSYGIQDGQHVESYRQDGDDRGKSAILMDLNDKWDAIVAESADLRAQLNQAIHQRDQLQVAKDESDRLVHEKEELLSSVCATIVDLENEVSRMSEEHRKLESQNQVMKTELGHATRKLGQLQLERETSDRILQEKEALLSKLSRLITELERKVLRIDTEKKGLEVELFQTNSALAKHRDAKAQLEKSFHDGEKEIQTLRMHLRQIDETIAASARQPATMPTSASFQQARGFPDQTRASDAGKDSAPISCGAPPNAPQTSLPQRSPPHFVDASQFTESRFALPDHFAFPSQRQNAVGQAIRDRTGVRLAGQTEEPKEMELMPEERSRNRGAPIQQREERQRTAPTSQRQEVLEEWPRTAPTRQREDVREPRGKRMTEDYTKPLRSQMQLRGAPVHGGHTTRSARRPTKDYKDYSASSASLPAAKHSHLVESQPVSSLSDPKQALLPPPYNIQNVSRQPSHVTRSRSGPTPVPSDTRMAVPSTQSASRRIPDVLRQQAAPRRAAEEPKSGRTKGKASELTPTEQRMAYIQQRIAEKVESTRRKTGMSSSMPQTVGQPSTRAALRPQYGRAPPSATQTGRVPSQITNPVSQPLAPDSRRPQYYPVGPQRAQPRTAPHLAPSYRSQSRQPPLSNHPLPYSQAAPQPTSSLFRPRQAPPTMILHANQSGRDPAGGHNPSSPHGNRFLVQQHEPFPLQNKPRYNVTHHVDPKGLQDVRNQRWKSMLGSSKVLS